MVAGATGIDIVAMVIAADEGVMPQTREHMDICTLLGVRHGLVVLTKTDMVDAEWLELVTDDIRTFVRGTFLEEQPIVPVSSVSGEGLPEFIRTLDHLSRKIPARSAGSLLRLPVDRVFSMKGFGTVITGTLTSGHISVGETIMLYPGEITAKVRGVQVHGQSTDRAEAGMRTAVNFQGLDRTRVSRGDVLSNPGALRPSYMLDMSFHFLAGNKKPFKNRTRVRFHSGTSEIPGNLILLEAEELRPGETAVAQIRLDTPVSSVRDDRFVIRSCSPVRTIGGGHILNPIPPKHKRLKPDVIEGLRGLMEQMPEEMIAYHLDESGYQGRTLNNLKIMTNMPEKKLQQALQKLLSGRQILQTDKESATYIHTRSFDKLRREIIAHLDRYHRKNPLKPGMPKEEIKSRIPAFVGAKLLTLTLNRLIRDGEIVQEEESIRLRDHKVSLGLDQADFKEKILDAYIRGGLTPPYFREFCRGQDTDPAQARDVLMILIDEGQIVKVKEDLYFHTDVVDKLKRAVVDFLRRSEEMSTPQFKEIAGVSRKYLIPLIEYFDSQNITIRVGDVRKLRGG
ncbi:selenocysteine-specific translation elongation f actor [Desulfonema ishimotonii]|uniref:Selenocysteine-specific translation elongation f actor n=2 Tax=Desulfonema ishimotonii TaxID=45657 RepID=A0A401G1N4_9BACT|nr:selenocysteine-specific translation elongation f actor [Desulfonema ishimotonii]